MQPQLIVGSDLSLPISAVYVPGSVAADFDDDGQVDSADYAIFKACATGSNVPYNLTVLPAPPGLHVNVGGQQDYR